MNAIKMIKKGICVEDISEFTGLSIEDVSIFKKKVENGEL